MTTGLRELRVWQEAVSLAGDVVRAARQGMRRETRSISDAAMLTALSVPTHIADGYARPAPADQRDSYQLARRALMRLETELAVAKHAELLPAGAFAELATRAGQVSKLLAGYLAYLDRQLADSSGRAVPDPREAGASAGLNPGSGRVPS